MAHTDKHFRTEHIAAFLTDLFKNDVHAKRVHSLAGAVVGVLEMASLAIYAIGQGLAAARGRTTKHAVKQVDRLLSNKAIDVWSYFAYWVPYVIGPRKEIWVALDWTEFDRDNHATIALNLITRHGRATPLMWLTVDKLTLKGRRNSYEDRLLQRFKEVLPEHTKVTLVADRGFGDQKLFEFLTEKLHFNYIIRIKKNVFIKDAKGEEKPASEWVGKAGRARILRDAQITKTGYAVAAVVCVHAKKMKEPWILVTNQATLKASEVIKGYGKRWSIEPSFRDTKDPHFGMGMKQLRISSTERRDRLLLISAIAVALLTFLGGAGESLGYDRFLKTNTVKKRVHSLFRQGQLLYDLIPNMPRERLLPLMERFGETINEHRVFTKVFGTI